MRRLRRGPLAAVPLLLLFAACGGSADVAADPDAPAPAVEGLVLRVEQVGGFTTPAMLAARLPVVSVYGDGLVITEGPQIAIYPGPALPNVLVREVGADGAERLVDLALAAGVGQDRDLGQPPIADATTTRFTVVTEQGVRRTEAYALLEHPVLREPLPGAPLGPDLGLTPEQQEARAELSGLLDALTDLGATLGPDAAGEEEPYEPQAVAALATPWVAPDDGLGEQPEVAWPGPGLPGKPLGPGLDVGCVTAAGEAADAVLAAAADATSATPWTSGGARWSLVLRPLLPDETGCADLLDGAA